MKDTPRARAPRPSRQPRSGGIVVPQKSKRIQRLAAGFVVFFEWILTSTLRFEWRDESGMFNGNIPKSAVFCVWHNRLALSMAIYRKWPQKRQPSRRLAALVSASKDGALLAEILERFGVQPVRGSTSRRGPQALLELTSWAERGYDLAITPDGPRGPRYEVQEGVIALAQLTGLPIIPVSYQTPSKLSLKSWDAFQVPLPFARCRIVFHRPIHIPREASDKEREILRLKVQEQLREISKD